jgi:hypothetical protein
VAGFEIVLRQFLSDFAGGGPDYRILARVIIRRTAKHFDPERTFFQGINVTQESLVDDTSQQALTSTACSKDRTGQDGI